MGRSNACRAYMCCWVGEIICVCVCVRVVLGLNVSGLWLRCSSVWKNNLEESQAKQPYRWISMMGTDTQAFESKKGFWWDCGCRWSALRHQSLDVLTSDRRDKDNGLFDNGLGCDSTRWSGCLGLPVVSFVSFVTKTFIIFNGLERDWIFLSARGSVASGARWVAKTPLERLCSGWMRNFPRTEIFVTRNEISHEFLELLNDFSTQSWRPGKVHYR